MHIHLTIKRLLENDNKLQQKDLAKVLGVTAKTAHNYLNGKTKIVADQIPAIAKLLDISVENLYLLSDPEFLHKAQRTGIDKFEEEPLSPEYQNSDDECANPKCMRTIGNLKDQIIELQKIVIELQRGGKHNGKSASGDMGKPRKTG